VDGDDTVADDTADGLEDDAQDEDAAPVEDDADTSSSVQESSKGKSDHERVANQSKRASAAAVADVSDDVDATVTAAAADLEPQSQTFSRAAVADDPAPQSSAAVFTTVATALQSAVPAPTVPQQPKTLVGVVTEFVAAVLQPLLGQGGGSPIQMPILTAALALVRNEFERIFAPRKTSVASQQTVTLLADPSPQPSLLVDPAQQHVLVIGVDGTNLSRILADPENENFLELMGTSTTAASSIVGHTTISNPSWTAILTGVWGERTGVINNVFTPWTYDRFPTVFNQLEALPSDVDTTAIGDWDVINAIAGVGSDGADVNLYVAQLEGDTNWLATDDRVADLTIDAIEGADAGPNFLFSYFVGVDENGHLYGGASEEYKLAIENVDDNLGTILDTVALRELNTGEDWTIIVVTDHGHQPQVGFGHGFQSPDETATFVIVDGPDFKDGNVNQAYEIVDTTPTVVSLFGGTPLAGADGVPLQSLGDGVHPSNLKQALEAEIAKNKSPDFVTDVALTLRTIFATVPYYVYTFGNDAGAGLPSFLVLPVQLLFDGLYIATNVPAQFVAFATGVSGASIFPLFPPAPPDFPPAEQATLPDSVVLVLCVPSSSGALCGEPSVA
jgi:arylsulfatase A-like enzyme